MAYRNRKHPRYRQNPDSPVSHRADATRRHASVREALSRYIHRLHIQGCSLAYIAKRFKLSRGQVEAILANPPADIRKAKAFAASVSDITVDDTPPPPSDQPKGRRRLSPQERAAREKTAADQFLVAIGDLDLSDI